MVAVDDKTPNAFVLPGGKIVVFTGETPRSSKLLFNVHSLHMAVRLPELCLGSESHQITVLIIRVLGVNRPHQADGLR